MSLTQEQKKIALECFDIFMSSDEGKFGVEDMFNLFFSRIREEECNCNELVEALEFAQKKLLESAHPYDEAAMKIGETLAKHKAMMGEEE